MPKVFVLGIDSAEPSLVFDEWKNDLPTINALASDGVWGNLKTTIPPITIPAWQSGLTGRNPGWLGLYDLRRRNPGTYTDFSIFNSTMIEIPRVWDYLSDRGLRSVLALIPGTYPPPEVQGEVVSGFFTPMARSNFTNPPGLRDEILGLVGGPDQYVIDVYDYRMLDPKDLYNQLKAKTEQDFKLIRHLLKTKRWDLFMSVIMTVDRAQHTLWRFFDSGHPRYEPIPELSNLLLDLHSQIDKEIERTLEILPKDTSLMLVSDHGAKRMRARINANELLAQEGYLKLRERPKRITGLKQLNESGLIDWSRSRAFALGAYVAQVWVNLKGREPSGHVISRDYEVVREELSDLFRSIEGVDGEKLDTRVYLKEEAYSGPKLRDMPDLTIYFDNLHYGSNEAMGHSGLYSLATERGPDDSNHGELGIFVIRDVEERAKGKSDGKIEDLMPTILSLFGVRPPDDLDGRSLV